MHLTSVSLRRIPPSEEHRFPFSVPAVANLGTLELTTPVTMLVGENGSGKSTLLEGLAAAVVHHQAPRLGWLAYSAGVTLLLAIVAPIVFVRLEPRFAESI